MEPAPVTINKDIASVPINLSALNELALACKDFGEALASWPKPADAQEKAQLFVTSLGQLTTAISKVFKEAANYGKTISGTPTKPLLH